MKRFVAVQVILLLSAAACGTPTGFETGVDAYERGDWAAAHGEFLPLAERGHAQAQNNLGFMYSQGRGVPQSEPQAAAWYRKAAERGDAKAQYNLGFMYRHGRGVPQNDVQAVAWWRKAAEQGDAQAQFRLAFMYEGYGRGVPQSRAQYRAWLRKAAERGHAGAQYYLGKSRDAQGVEWMRKAAEQGLAQAQYELGEMYAEGQGVPRDYAQAAAWYRKAAEQGHAEAQFELGEMYASGQGVPQDYVRAHAWLEMTGGMAGTIAFDIMASLRESMTAAQIAEAHAQVLEWSSKNAERAYGLGIMYYSGLGMPRDYVRAYAWFDIAAAGGHQEALKFKEALRKIMTDAQVAEAQRLGADLEGGGED